MNWNVTFRILNCHVVFWYISLIMNYYFLLTYWTKLWKSLTYYKYLVSHVRDDSIQNINELYVSFHEGYRCFKAVMFLSGFIFGGTVVYVICQEEKIVNHNLSPGAIIGECLFLSAFIVIYHIYLCMSCMWNEITPSNFWLKIVVFALYVYMLFPS